MRTLKEYPCGLRVAHEFVSSVRSVAIGFQVGTGSVNESEKNNGISHFIEHMVFKGTGKRSAFQIASEIDEIGAAINAFTGKTATCYYTVSLSGDAEQCFDILSDIFFNAAFDEQEMEKEKGVILEEIAMVQDSPDDLSIELAAEAYFKGHPLERTILGTKKNVKNFTRADITEYISERYTPSNTVISIVGDISFEETDKLINKYVLPFFKAGKKPDDQIALSPGNSVQVVKFKDIEQSNIAIIFPSIAVDHPKASALHIFNNVFGGGMSSRLFQNIREQKGLAYSVYSYPSAYQKEGLFAIYLGTNKESVSLAVTAVKEEIERALKEGISEAEFKKGKAQEKSAFVFGQESTSTLMRIYAKHLLTKGTLYDIDKKLKEIDDVTMEDVREVIKTVFDFNRMTAAYVGPEAEVKIYDILKGE